MAINRLGTKEFGTKISYSAEPYKTEGLTSKEFWGDHHVDQAVACLQEHARKANKEPANFYHYFEPLQKGEYA